MTTRARRDARCRASNGRRRPGGPARSRGRNVRNLKVGHRLASAVLPRSNEASAPSRATVPAWETLIRGRGGMYVAGAALVGFGALFAAVKAQTQRRHRRRHHAAASGRTPPAVCPRDGDRVLARLPAAESRHSAARHGHDVCHGPAHGGGVPAAGVGHGRHFDGRQMFRPPAAAAARAGPCRARAAGRFELPVRACPDVRRARTASWPSSSTRSSSRRISALAVDRRSARRWSCSLGPVGSTRATTGRRTWPRPICSGTAYVIGLMALYRRVKGRSVSTGADPRHLERECRPEGARTHGTDWTDELERVAGGCRRRGARSCRPNQRTTRSRPLRARWRRARS